ncbi:MAG TPA: hypothetical protein VLC79_09370 [Cellvibrio sp.]|nr:hypothetical protein [Cellvibrio sp.]
MDCISRNFTIFAIEIIFSLQSKSVSLLADSIEFLGDAANYGISLWVLVQSVWAHANVSLFKATSLVFLLSF